MKPKCIIVTGRPGSGKTTLSKKLGELLWMPVIIRDEIKEGYVNTHGVKHDQLPPDANGRVTDIYFDLVNQYLAGMVSVVIEAAFQHRVWESRMPKIQELSSPIMIHCSIDGVIAAKRHLQRGLDKSTREFYHGDNRVSHYKKTGEFLLPDEYVIPNFKIPTIQVATEGDYSPSIDDIVNQIRASDA